MKILKTQPEQKKPQRVEGYFGPYSPKPFTPEKQAQAMCEQVMNDTTRRQTVFSIMAAANPIGKTDDFSREEIYDFWIEKFNKQQGN